MNFRAKRIVANTLSGILVSLIIPIIFATIFLLILNAVYIETPVVGYSMLPTFNMSVPSDDEYGDVVYINKIRKLERNTVVVAEVKWNSDPVIKRLIGLPGDIIEIKEEQNLYNLYVNSNLITTKEKTDFSIDGMPGGTNEYYKSYIKYLEQHENGNQYIELAEDEYFIMGDNWGRTTDSLAQGPVSKKEILGTVDTFEEYQTSDKWFLIKYTVKNIFNF